MQGLVGWRCGLSSPVPLFREGIARLRHGVWVYCAMVRGKGRDVIKRFPLERASFLEFLISDKPFAFAVTDLVADRLLDALLGRGLRGAWDDAQWAAGLDQLRKVQGSTLAVESYTTYCRLLRPSRDSDLEADAARAVSLFEQRKRNHFLGGGDQTEGEGNDNAVTVDYRLAAILKKVGLRSASVHSWRWG